jgi:alkaline phosphatase
MKHTLRTSRTLVGATLALGLLFMPTLAFAKGSADSGTDGANKTVAAKGDKPAKYVFLFIGDGMAMSQISSAEVYATARSSKDISAKRLGFSQFPVSGLTTTYDAKTFITDSASAGTAIASGNKNESGVVNMDLTKTVKFKTIAEYAHDAGKKVGIVTSVSLDHATPACFYAKEPSRGNYYNIAVQLANSKFEYFGGGGFLQPKGKDKDQADVVEMAKANGFKYVNTNADFAALKAGAGRVIAVNETLQDSSSMPYDMDRSRGDLSLADYTKKGIELLSDDPDGFFMMVEGGKIDWACHANDAAASINDTLAFDRAIAEAVAFADTHPGETLIVVTGDHETGGMTLGFAGTKYSTSFDKISLQKASYVAFGDKVLTPYKASVKKDQAKITDLTAAINEYFGLDYATLTALQKDDIDVAFQRTMGNEVIRPVKEDTYLLYGGYEPLTVKITQILNQNAGIGWTSYSHTGVPVATFARGAHQDLFGGYYDNTDIFKKLASAMQLATVAM